MRLRRVLSGLKEFIPPDSGLYSVVWFNILLRGGARGSVTFSKTNAYQWGLASFNLEKSVKNPVFHQI
jgi:hypothetical protein